MKKIITSFLMAIMALGVWAADPEVLPEVLLDLTTSEEIGKCTQSEGNFAYNSGSIRLWKYQVSNFNEYLLTPALNLSTASQYAVQVGPRLYSNGTSSKVEVLVGQGDNIEDYTLLDTFSNLPYMVNDVIVHDVKFTVSVDGDYKVCFRVNGAALYLRDTKIVNYGQSAQPKAPEDFTVTPDPEGELKVTISFTMPSLTLTGQALTNQTYTLYRGEEIIEGKEKISATGGSSIEFTETVSESDYYTYSVEIEDGENISEKVSNEVYVGIETPTAPTDVTVNESDGKFEISWAAPSVGIHDVVLAPERLIYSISRFIDGKEDVLQDNLKNATNYSDEFEYSNLHKLQYKVKAKYVETGDFSDFGESQAFFIGKARLPYAYSFASQEIESCWKNVKVTPENFEYSASYWHSADSQSEFFMSEEGSSERPTISPYDEDGGFAYYQCTSGYSGRLISPVISYFKGENPVLTFARFVNYSTSTDELKVQISIDGEDWIDVENGTFINGNGEENAWVEELVNLSDYLNDDVEEYQIAFFAVSSSESIHKNIYLDAIRIVNVIEKDLAIEKFAVSEKAHAGDFITLSIKVANNGNSEVASDAYSVEVEHDFAEDFEIGNLRNIPSMSSVTYQVSLPVHSLHLYNVNSFEFTAKVTYEGDQAPDNNESEPQIVVPSYSAGNGVKIEKSTFDEDGNYYLYWTSAKDPDYIAVNIVESFEDESFEEDSTGPFNGWVTIDLDGQSGGTHYTASGSKFNLAKNVSTPGSSKDGKNVLGVTLASNVQQDDWIISPMVNCKQGSVMDLSFLFAVKTASSSGNDYKVEILYTTQDEYDMENPAEAFTETHAVGDYSYSSYNPKVPQDNNMHRVEFPGIPAEAKYVALHFISKGNYTPAMWVDDIHLVENDPNPLLGYHVYSFEVGGRLNDELIDADATEFVFKPASVDEPAAAKHRAPALATGEPNVFVAAVYADGEAKAENVWNYADQSVTGIENVSVDSVDGQAEYFNLQGMKVSGDNLTPGIYIIRAGSTSQKVLVK